MAKPTMVSEAEFGSKVLEAAGPVLVDFYADWCGPCKMIAPALEELAGEYEGKLTVYKLDIDEAQQTAGRYGVMSIPTLMFFQNGKPIHKIIGAKPKAAMKAEIEKAIGTTAAK